MTVADLPVGADLLVWLRIHEGGLRMPACSVPIWWKKKRVQRRVQEHDGEPLLSMSTKSLTLDKLVKFWGCVADGMRLKNVLAVLGLHCNTVSVIWRQLCLACYEAASDRPTQFTEACCTHVPCKAQVTNGPRSLRTASSHHISGVEDNVRCHHHVVNRQRRLSE